MNSFKTFVYSIFLSMIVNMVYADETYGPIQSGEMLWDIASKIRPSQEVSRHQAIIALLKTNPHAFRIACNINSLKIKQILNVPDLATIQILTHKEAIAEYNRQNDQWKTYRGRRSQIKCPIIEKNAANTTVSEAITPTETKQVSPPAPSQAGFSTTPPTLSDVPQEVIYTSDSLNKQAVEPTALENLPVQPVENNAHWTAAVTRYFENMPISINLIVAIIGAVLFLTFVIGWILHRHAAPKNEQGDIIIDDFPLPSVIKPNQSAISKQNTPALQFNAMAQNLIKIRDYMNADDIISISPKIDGLLQEVLEKGSAEQQQEARQLLGIKKKLIH